MKKDKQITREEERLAKWALGIIIVIVIMALTANTLYEFIEGLASIVLVVGIVKGIIWLGNNVW